MTLLAAAGCSSASPRPRAPAGEVGRIAFETVRAVLQHPRCQNCHPEGDAPLQGDDGHAHRNGGKDMAALRKHLDTSLVVWGWRPGADRAPVPTPYRQFIAAWETWANAGAPCP
jgi:hypothetical protein